MGSKISGGVLLLRVLYSFELPKTVKVGKNVIFEHRGLGTVINVNSEIGDNSIIQHHVTIGLKEYRGQKNSKAPKIGKNVKIGAYATILGDITIGDNVVIGANTLVLQDIEPNTIVVSENKLKKIN